MGPPPASPPRARTRARARARRWLPAPAGAAAALLTAGLLLALAQAQVQLLSDSRPRQLAFGVPPTLLASLSPEEPPPPSSPPRPPQPPPFSSAGRYLSRWMLPGRSAAGCARLRGGAPQPPPQDVSDDSGDSEWENSWIYQHTARYPFYCEVNPEWIRDTFNLNGLQAAVPHYETCLRRILDYDVGFEKLPPKRAAELESCCDVLYGLIHSRYILSPEGLDRMRQKYERGDFGSCPRALCRGTRLLPTGIADELRLRPVKTFCPGCRELYHVRVRHAASIDGAYYTRTFPHLFLLKYPHLQPRHEPVKYQPTIFGFDVKYPDLPTADEYAREEAARHAKEKEEQEKRMQQALEEQERKQKTKNDKPHEQNDEEKKEGEMDVEDANGKKDAEKANLDEERKPPDMEK
mmetsp:Transcript_32388/g.78830  ORF Transcript_32388/g.78830 Transcript_32388/m.78830 type:complete len:407 (+) Transcript_32388:1-1221(+)